MIKAPLIWCFFVSIILDVFIHVADFESNIEMDEIKMRTEVRIFIHHVKVELTNLEEASRFS